MLRTALALVTAALALGAAVLPRPPTRPAERDAASGPGTFGDPEPVREAPPPSEATEAAAPRADARACPRCEDTPDLTQTAPELGLPGGGVSHCGPVAAANALVWLSRRGFPALAPAADPGALVRQLASPAYMRTHERRGTLPFDLVEGLERWVRDAGYQVETLAYAGVRDHPSRRSAGLVRPSLAFLQAGLERGGVVLLHLGWYAEARPGRLTREGGHWVTLIELEGATRTLRLHDPAPYTPSGHTERAQAELVTEGRLLRPAGLGQIPARGFLELGSGFPRRSPHERAIVDGALVLRVR